VAGVAGLPFSGMIRNSTAIRPGSQRQLGAPVVESLVNGLGRRIPAGLTVPVFVPRRG
jgi:hypothetical protein